jgi:pimeloyl-ACP methyl ester carboxylesterase
VHKPVLLCLHGWGGSKESFTELRAALEGAPYQILTPDLPGFGAAPEPPQAWSVEEYANWVMDWLHAQGWHDTPIVLLGHSHGGRIAILMASRGMLPIRHLVLCAAAGIRHPRHWKRIFGLLLAKIGKAFFGIPGLRTFQSLARRMLYRLVRVHDYERASPVMQQTLVRVTAQDLTPLLSRIHVPTDIFWGTDDGMTPVSDAHVMHERIHGSELHLFPGIRHGVHRERAKEIAAALRTVEHG